MHISTYHIEEKWKMHDYVIHVLTKKVDTHELGARLEGGMAGLEVLFTKSTSPNCIPGQFGVSKTNLG